MMSFSFLMLRIFIILFTPMRLVRVAYSFMVFEMPSELTAKFIDGKVD
jgi:hypothetical protein